MSSDMNIIIFSGTTEGRRISEYLSSRAVSHRVCVATKSGETVMEQSDYANVNVGRLNEREIRDFLTDIGPGFVVDATHPYAKDVTDNLQRVCNDLGYEYLRVNRESMWGDISDYAINSYESTLQCAEALRQTSGNILLSTGSKELSCYMEIPELKDRIYVRVLPTIEAITLCQNAGVDEKHIIAMYGPHTKEMNIATLLQYDIRHLVTKESGLTGGFMEKVEAAKGADTVLHVIERPDNAKGISVMACIQRINELYGLEAEMAPKLHVKLVGMGPGNELCMTVAAKCALEEADYVFGASRMLDGYKGRAATISEYMPGKVLGHLEEIMSQETKSQINVVLLFSGDTGLYSGASKMYKSLMKWGHCDSIDILPGISSFSTFAAMLGIDYQNSYLESLHGKAQDRDNQKRIESLIADGKRVMVLMSGKEDFDVLKNLIPDDFGRKIIIGYNLSYENQRVIYTNLKALEDDIKGLEDGLFIVLVDSGIC